jgi:protein TonB
MEQLRGQLGSQRLRWALLASLALHLLLLWPEPPGPPVRETTTTLQATVRITEAPAAPSPEPIRPSPRPPAAAVERAVAPVKVLESPAALPVPRLPAVVTKEAAIPSAVPAAVAASPPGAVADRGMPGAASAAAVVPAAGDALDGLRAYRLSVATQARRFKRYPAEAQAAGATGSAEVRLEVGGDGTPRPATVARSSGHVSLDRAALAMIDAGAARARLPEGLRGREFAVLLPVVFDLDER